MRSIFLLLTLITICSCQDTGRNIQFKTLFTQQISNSSLLNKRGKTVLTRFNPPKSFTRVSTKEGSFAHYLQNFPLKKHGSKVHLYNGELKHRQDVHAAILDIDVGKRDLQQCADATMRLRAEYLYQQKEYDKIHFNFTNGFNASYSKWRQGYHIRVKGNHVSWIHSAQPATGYTSFRKYLNMVFSYAGTLSLSKELPAVNLNKITIGDIFIQGGSPGHAIIVMDMAKDSNGNTLILLAQSYMPAQEIHILKNPNDADLSPWYSLKNLKRLETPEWLFTNQDIKRFF